MGKPTITYTIHCVGLEHISGMHKCLTKETYAEPMTRHHAREPVAVGCELSAFDWVDLVEVAHVDVQDLQSPRYYICMEWCPLEQGS